MGSWLWITVTNLYYGYGIVLIKAEYAAVALGTKRFCRMRLTSPKKKL